MTSSPGSAVDPATDREAHDLSYLGRLATRSQAAGTVLCLGLDPDPGSLPDGFSADLRGVEAFARLVARR